MKELSIEEKAKRYDESLERMKSWAKGEHPECFTEAQKAAEFIFPELKESEDERIRKELLDYCKNKAEKYPNDPKYVNINNWIAWLEKQGKHKSIWHNEDEEPQRGSLVLFIMQSGTPVIAKIIEPYHTFNRGERWAYIDDLLEKQCDNANKVEPKDYSSIDPHFFKPTDKFEPKFKVGDMIKPKDPVLGEPRIIKGIHPKFGYDTNNGILDFEFEDNWEKLVEQNPAWSDEDENVLEDIEEAIINYWHGDTQDILLDWLKSIRPQNRYVYNPYKAVVESIAAMVEKYAPFDSNLQDFYDNVKVKCKDAKEYDSLFPQSQWKPSDEQMAALWSATEKYLESDDENVRKLRGEVLESLYEDLKKLREE